MTNTISALKTTTVESFVNVSLLLLAAVAFGFFNSIIVGVIVESFGVNVNLNILIPVTVTVTVIGSLFVIKSSYGKK